jgi:membrane-bound serine protease (ClpP class)
VEGRVVSAVQEIFAVLLVAGLFLVGAEVFLPGGILGVAGGLALVGAVILGFIAFPGYGVYIAIGIIAAVGVVVALWIRFFPRTRIGRSMTVSRDLAASKATQPGLERLLGRTGRSASELRPAGFAIIDGDRVDVVSDGRLIARDRPVQVVLVEGNRIVVTEVQESVKS